jgi:hypothetical protein
MAKGPGTVNGPVTEVFTGLKEEEYKYLDIWPCKPPFQDACTAIGWSETGKGIGTRIYEGRRNMHDEYSRSTRNIY